MRKRKILDAASLRLPDTARRLRYYSELGSYLNDFVEGRYPFLWLVGRPGVGKTELMKAAVRGRRVCYRKGGQLTPLQFHKDCYEYRTHPIILDDADPLLDDPIGAKQVSSLGEVTGVKRLYYGSTTAQIGEVPQSFATTSPLCVISNRATSRPDIQSRAVILYFDPTDLEVHQDAARWFWDQEIHDWIGRHMGRLQPLESRRCVRAFNDKMAGRDWREILLNTHGEKKKAVILVQDLEHESAYPTREDKARRYAELMGDSTGKSRATYFRLRRRLEEAGRLAPEAVKPIRLRHTRPPSMPTLAELDALESDLAPPAPRGAPPGGPARSRRLFLAADPGVSSPATS